MRKDIRNYINQKPVSIVRIGTEILMKSDTTRGVIQAHERMQTGLAVFGIGLTGLAFIRAFTK